MFLYADRSGKVVSAPVPVVQEGSGEAGSVFYCADFTSDTYKVSWRVFRASDALLSNPLVWLRSTDFKEIRC